MKLLIRYQSVLMVIIALASALSGRAQSSSDLDDSAIIGIYNQVNSFDIESALLAANQADSADVRKLSQQVARDHRAVRLAAAELAKSMGIAESIPASRQEDMLAHDRAMADLAKLTGREFDRAYLLHEIAFHEAAIKALKTILLPSAKDARLKKHFESVLPHFEHHLNASVGLAQTLGYRS